MTRSRNATLSRRALRLKNAFRDLVDEFGGQVAVAAYWSEKTGRVIRQQWISDLCHRNIDEFPPVDLVAELEAHVHGRVGHPHVTRALAGLQDFLLVTSAAARGESDLSSHLIEIAGEAGDVMRALTDVLDGKIDAPACEQRAVALREARQLMDAASTLCARLGDRNLTAVCGASDNQGEKGRAKN